MSRGSFTGLRVESSGFPKEKNHQKQLEIYQNDPKIIVTFFWNPICLQVIDGMESGQRFNSSYFIERILKKMALDECVAKAKKKQTKIHPPYG